jgi:hypothetical protein
VQRGITRPARETLFTVVSREDKYKSKAVIDTFVYRTGDVVGAWTEGLLGRLGGRDGGAHGSGDPAGCGVGRPGPLAGPGADPGGAASGEEPPGAGGCRGPLRAITPLRHRGTAPSGIAPGRVRHRNTVVGTADPRVRHGECGPNPPCSLPMMRPARLRVASTIPLVPGRQEVVGGIHLHRSNPST